MEEEVKRLTEQIENLDISNPADLKIAVSLIQEAQVLLNRIRAEKIKYND